MLRNIPFLITNADILISDNGAIISEESQQVINTVSTESNLWQIIYSIADFVGIVTGIVVGFTVIGTFLITYFFKRIKILDWFYSSDMYNGYRFGFSIQNRCLSTLSFKRISLILNDTDEIVLFTADPLALTEAGKPYLSITPFQSESVCSKYSTLPLLQKGSLGEYKKIVFCFTYPDDKEQIIRYRFRKKKKKFTNVIYPKQEVLCGVHLTSFMKYIVEYRDKSNVCGRCIVFKNGSLSEMLGCVTHVPEEHLASSESLKDFLDNTLDEMSFDVYYNKYFKLE